MINLPMLQPVPPSYIIVSSTIIYIDIAMKILWLSNWFLLKRRENKPHNADIQHLL